MGFDKDALNRVVDHVTAHPGLTTAQVAAGLPDLSPSTVRRLCWEMEKHGLFTAYAGPGLGAGGTVRRLLHYYRTGLSRPPA